MSATEKAPMSRKQIWLAGSRPRTWPAGIVPVVVGTGAAIYADGFSWWRALLAFIVGLSLQIGVNYANDYSDGIRGTDENRVGPLRLTASGLASADAVKRAAFISFGVGALAGWVLAIVVQPFLMIIGGVCIAAAWNYTGGKKPYGYSGFGEVAVFVFFGLVATVGTTYVQVERFTLVSLLAAVAVGALAVALLVVNNLRDIPTDTASGKRTLAVRLGDSSTRWFYFLCLVVPFVMILPLALFNAWALIALVSIALAVVPARTVLGGAAGPKLVPVLQGTGQLQMAFGVLLAVGLSL